MFLHNSPIFIKSKEMGVLPKNPRTGKHTCLVVLSENDDFMNSVTAMEIRKSVFKKIFIPTTQAPLKTFMTPEYKKKILENGYRPFKGNLENINLLKNDNFYIDAGYYIDALYGRFKLKTIQYGKPLVLFTNYLGGLNNINKDMYDVVLVYAVNKNNPIPKAFKNKKEYPILYILTLLSSIGNVRDNFVFDKIVNFEYFKNERGIMEKTYMVVFDKNQKNNLNRMKTELFKISQDKASMVKVPETVKETEDDVVKDMMKEIESDDSIDMDGINPEDYEE